MRPLDKGACPIDPATGRNKVVTDYDQWRADLIKQIGFYCAYCNMPLSHSLQVEHVIAKNPMPGQPHGLRLAWANMLLACGPCNNAKDNKPMLPTTHFLPEDHNTYLYFETFVPHPDPDAAIVRPKTGLVNPELKQAQDTVDRLKLDNIDRRPDVVDIRWMHRFAALQAIAAYRNIFDMAKRSPTYNENIAAESIAKMSTSVGFFSLWYDAFADEPKVMEKLIHPDFVPGTAQHYFIAYLKTRSANRHSFWGYLKQLLRNLILKLRLS